MCHCRQFSDKIHLMSVLPSVTPKQTSRWREPTARGFQEQAHARQHHGSETEPNEREHRTALPRGTKLRQKRASSETPKNAATENNVPVRTNRQLPSTTNRQGADDRQGNIPRAIREVTSERCGLVQWQGHSKTVRINVAFHSAKEHTFAERRTTFNDTLILRRKCVALTAS